MKGWFGGPLGPVWPYADTVISGISVTAIAVTYTINGFAVAADGRSRWRDESTRTDAIRSQESDNEQKIFKGQYKGRDFAYALSGAVYNKDKTFSLIQESDKALTAFAKTRINSLHEFVEFFASGLNSGITAALQDGRLELLEDMPDCSPVDKGAIANIFLAGYFRKRKPSLVMIRLLHANGQLQEPRIHTMTPPDGNLFMAGERMRELLGTNQHFAKYAEVINSLQHNSPLTDTVKCARMFIDACCDPVAAELDPKCKGIGGHVHIATVTESAGFKWEIAPKEKGDSGLNESPESK